MAETHRTPRRRPVELKPLLADLRFKAREYYFITAHRAETVDPLENLEAFLRMLAVLDKPGIFPLHPRTKKRLREHKLEKLLKALTHIKVLPPVNHRSALWLAANSAGVLTDSGGLQKEAYWAGVRCWIMREVTEWAMLKRTGWNTLVGLSPKQLQHYLAHPRPTQDTVDPIFARTNASSEIVRILKREIS
jgi:UDP-N-acetylglucosamine 2-epimerase